MRPSKNTIICPKSLADIVGSVLNSDSPVTIIDMGFTKRSQLSRFAKDSGSIKISRATILTKNGTNDKPIKRKEYKHKVFFIYGSLFCYSMIGFSYALTLNLFI